MQKLLSRYLIGAEIDAIHCARCQQACGECQHDFSLVTTGYFFGEIGFSLE
jgi:hypothetical protein